METASPANEAAAFSGILLVAGCSIGGGMIGLPVVSAYAGFLPSTLMLFLSSFFMTCTGLLVLEAVLWFKKEINLITLARCYLGKVGEKITWFTFLSIFYCLLIAYIAGSGELIGNFLNISSHMSSIVALLLVAGILIFGARGVDISNTLFFVGLLLSYGLLIGLGCLYVKNSNFLYTNWQYALPCIPIMLISFGYHNLVPTLISYLKRNVKALRMAIIVGNAIPLLFYLLWQFVILGLMPEGGSAQFYDVLRQSDMATGLLKEVASSRLVIAAAHAFAFFAIITSFITNALTCVDFLADGFSLSKTFKVKMTLVALVLLPPFFLSLFFPHLFLKALGYAGGFATVVLFGILPSLIVWKGRYSRKEQGERILFGGRFVLAILLLLSLFFLLLEFKRVFA